MPGGLAMLEWKNSCLLTPQNIKKSPLTPYRIAYSLAHCMLCDLSDEGCQGWVKTQLDIVELNDW